MTLHDLYEQIAPTLPLSMQKDLKTAIGVLSRALHYEDPHVCPVDACLQPSPALAQLVEAHLLGLGKGYYTVRNTKNLLRRLFQEAERQRLLTLPTPTPQRRFPLRPTKRRPGSEHVIQDGSYLPFHRWPARLQQEFAAFSTWASSPVVDGRDAKLRKRPITVRGYLQTFETFFGFLTHIQQMRRIRFDDLFTFSHIKAFTTWYVNVKHRRVTRRIHMMLDQLLALTRQYRPLPAFRAQIQELKRTLPMWTPQYQKSDAWVPLEEIERIGLSLWPRKLPQQLSSTGQRSANAAGLSLMFRLWVRIPYRSRNIRQMQLGHNLYQDAHRTWRIRFVGEELKIGTRRGHLNTFDLPFPQDLTPILEAYVHTWRPLLVSKKSPLQKVFLTTWGRPYGQSSLREITRSIVYRYTGQLWHPHIIRTVWVTEYIRHTGDFYGAAIMLNDTLEIVIKNYAHLRDENIADQTYQWVRSHLTPGAAS